MKKPRNGGTAVSLTIDELHLDVHGVTREAARAAVDQLGPALARALADRVLNVRSMARLDAGRIAIDANPSGTALADRIAAQVADTTTKD
jgi:hypothetical protein